MFGFDFDKTETCTITNVHFDLNTSTGTCKLVSTNNTNTNIYTMTWSIINFPMETIGMPGSPYSIKVTWNIAMASGSQDHALNAITGHIIYKINSGTFPNFSSLGIRYGEYFANGLNIKSGKKTQILLKLNEIEPSYVYLFS